MAFPGNGMEGTYRNHIDDVASMLRNYHKGHYRIYNLSGRSYDTTKFDKEAVQNWCSFPDHNPPPLETLLTLVSNMHAYLSADLHNVVVVHCLAGKGRTGTVIACYMLYAGLFVTSGDALRYFAHKRSATISGVSYPGQLRYVNYAQHLFDRVDPVRPKRSPVLLHSLTLSHVPKLSLNVMGTSFGITPVLEVFSVSHNKLYGQCVTLIYSSAWGSKASTNTLNGTNNSNNNNDNNNKKNNNSRTRTTSSTLSLPLPQQGQSSPSTTSSSPSNSQSASRSSLPLHFLAAPGSTESTAVLTGELETYTYEKHRKPLVFPIGKAIRGDVLITLSHCPSASSKLQQVFRLNFHTGYLDLATTTTSSSSSSSSSNNNNSNSNDPTKISIATATTCKDGGGGGGGSVYNSFSGRSPGVHRVGKRPTSFALPRGLCDVTRSGDVVSSDDVVRTAVFRKTEVDCIHKDRRFPSDFEVALTYQVGNFSLDHTASRAFERAADTEEALVNSTLKTIVCERPTGETCFFDPAIDNSLFPSVSAKIRMARAEVISGDGGSGTCNGMMSGGGGVGSSDSGNNNNNNNNNSSSSSSSGGVIGGLGTSGGNGCGNAVGGVGVEKTGWLTKQGEKVRSWKKRWFVLRNNVIYYYSSPKSKTPKGVIPLMDIMAVVTTTPPMDSTHTHCFEIVVSKGSGSVLSSPSSSSSSSSSSSYSSSSSSLQVSPSPPLLLSSSSSGAHSSSSSSSSGNKFSIRSYYINAENDEEKNEWAEAIELARAEDDNQDSL